MMPIMDMNVKVEMNVHSVIIMKNINNIHLYTKQNNARKGVTMLSVHIYMSVKQKVEILNLEFKQYMIMI